jgi:acyl transferase domain-containing protein
LLEEKRSGYKDFDSQRINPDGYYHPNPLRPGSIHTKGAQLLDSDSRLFDHSFFSMPAGEVLTMDPMQRKMLEVSYEAMEAAGETWETFWGSNTGVFIGNFNVETIVQQSLDRDFALPYTATGGGLSILSNRINYLLNLKGPSLTVDTACASSMYALHLAVNSLRAGDCDAAIVGGTNLIQNPDMQQMIVGLGAGSGTSTCHTFDAAADGYCRAEGFGALYLRRYGDSIDKYPIRAIVRGTAINSNGKTAGISHPSSEGQEALIRQAYKSAGLPTHLTGYVECHGTGTPVGDPLEVAAVANVFNAGRNVNGNPLLIGSVKTNLGHSEAASGVTGIMKAILAMEHGMIPATIGIKELNPNIDFEAAHVQVVTEMTPWPKDKLRRVSVNSFGQHLSATHSSKEIC